VPIGYDEKESAAAAAAACYNNMFCQGDWVSDMKAALFEEMWMRTSVHSVELIEYLLWCASTIDRLSAALADVAGYISIFYLSLS